MPPSTCAVVVYFCVEELKRDLWVVGHAHGVAALAFVRMTRTLKHVAILQTNLEEINESGEHHLERFVGKSRVAKATFSFLEGLLFSRKTAIVFCLLALVACGTEIFYDMSPGGHHGAALLAVSELVHQFFRLKNKPEYPMIRRFIVLGVAVPAACFAMYEMYEDLQPGAHHAVAVLAAAELMENIFRGKAALSTRLKTA
eukprot:FR739811.1.p1 GENE.FR739811.1~~FR739811.1.p1  ORF type:complete len:200 (+),score=10.87 FR739811.1:198-797(+)